MVKSGSHPTQNDLELLKRYQVQLVRTSAIKPSPENSEIYGAPSLDSDPALSMLMRSIERLGLEEPLILTIDGFILSGHRRFFALQQLGWKWVPVRFSNVTRAASTDYHRLLAQYNPQRVKSVATVLSESLLEGPEADSTESWSEYHAKRSNPEMDAMQVGGCKSVEIVGPRQKEFLEAVKAVVEDLRPYWPLTVRQVHYKLLNRPPLTQTTLSRNERWRYRNDPSSYQKLCSLLVCARYHGHVAWSAIDDATRESRTFSGFENPSHFIRQEVSGFLTGYHRDRQEGQPNYIEVLIEKNTLVNIVADVCGGLYVPFTPLRGYAGPSVWREIEIRYRQKVAAHTGPVPPKCILIILSDHDPEGLNLADDAVRSLRDNHGVEVEAIRPAVRLDQVRQFNLHPNLAKESSSRYQEYVRKTGTRECWECEALDPEVLRRLLRDAILSVTDVAQLNAVQEREAEEKAQLAAIRSNLGTKLQEMINEGQGL